MKKNFYLATVHIVVEADNEGYASDAISECLTGNLEHNGAILDWGYITATIPEKSLLSIGEFDTADYEEGDFINRI